MPNKKLAIGAGFGLPLRQWGLWVICCGVLLTTACGGGGGAVTTASVKSPPPPTAVAPSQVQVSPSTIDVGPSQEVHFTASVSPPEANQSVQWSFGPDCIVGGFPETSRCGTLDNSGKYTAPPTIPVPGPIIVRAMATTDPKPVGEATIRLEAGDSSHNNGSFLGQYALMVAAAFDNTLDGNQALAAVLTADGNGNITGTCDDPARFVLSGALVGQYWLGNDHRARISVTCGAGPARILRVAFVPPPAGQAVQRGLIIQLGYPDQDLAAGLIAKQDPTALSAAAFAGEYAFGLGPIAGRFTARQDASSGNVITSGQLDFQFGSFSQPNLSFTGDFEVDSQGRGRLLLSGIPSVTVPPPFLPVALDDLLREFRLYVISRDEVIVLPTFSVTGCCPVGPAVSIGLALRQGGLPFASQSLTGSAVLLATQTDTETPYDTLLGVVAFNGAGTFNGSGERMLDVSTHQVGVPISGVYSLAPDGLGRGNITINGVASVFYMVRPGKAFLGVNSLPNLLESQTGGPFSAASLAGEYALGGIMPPFWGETTGVLSTDGENGYSAVLDSFVGPILPYPQVTPTTIGEWADLFYDTGPDGRTTVILTATGGNRWEGVFYLLSPSKAVGIWTNTGGTAMFEK